MFCRQIVARQAQNLSVCALSWALLGCAVEGLSPPDATRTAECIEEVLKATRGVEFIEHVIPTNSDPAFPIIGFDFHDKSGRQVTGNTEEIRGVGQGKRDLVFYINDDAINLTTDTPLTETFKQGLDANCRVRARLVARHVE